MRNIWWINGLQTAYAPSLSFLKRPEGLLCTGAMMLLERGGFRRREGMLPG